MNTPNTAWSKTAKYVVGVSLALIGIYILHLSQEVIPLLVIAALIAVLTRPAISWLHERAHLSRGLSVVIVYLLGIILIPLALMLAIPAIVDAVNYVLNLDYPGLLQTSLEWLKSALASIKAAQLPVGSLDAYVDQIVSELLISLQSAAPTSTGQTPSVVTILQSVGAALTTTFSTITSLVGAVVSNLVLVIFIFLASIYMSLNAHTYRESFLSAIPEAYQPEIDILLARIGRMWSAFFRGELTLMLVIGVISWLGLTILGMPGALYLGIIAGLLELIPNLGPIIATIPAAIVALLHGSSYLPVSPLAMALLVVLFYILVQQLENNLIVPRILGEAVDLPPLVVMTGVLVGATAAGLLGALLVTPIIASAREILHYIYGKMLGKDPFPPGEVVIEPEPQPVSWLNRALRRWTQGLTRARTPGQPPPAARSIQPASSEPEEQAFQDKQ